MNYISCSSCIRKTLNPFFIDDNTNGNPLCEICFRQEMSLPLVSSSSTHSLLFDKIDFPTSTDPPSSPHNTWTCQFCKKDSLLSFTCECARFCVCFECYKIKEITCQDCNQLLQLKSFHTIREAYHCEQVQCPFCFKLYPRFGEAQHLATVCSEQKKYGSIVEKTDAKDFYFIYSQGLTYFSEDQSFHGGKRTTRS